MSQLTEKIRAKYPQYENVDDVELESRILAKYPQYLSLTDESSVIDPTIMRQAGMKDPEIEQMVRNSKLQIRASLGNLGGNIVRSGGRVIGDTLGAIGNIFNPNLEKNTIANLGRVAVGGVQNLIPGEQGLEKNFNDIGRYYGQRYGITSALRGDFDQAGRDIGTTAYFDPTGVALDASALASGVGAGAKGVGTLTKSSRLASFGDDALRVGNAIDPMYQVSRRGGQIINRGIRGLDDYSRNYATAGLGNPAKVGEADSILKNIDFERIDPVTGKRVTVPMKTADLISEGNLYGRSSQDVIDYSNKLANRFDEIANNPNLPVRIDDIIRPLDEAIESTNQSLIDFPGEKAFETQLQELTRQRQNLLNKSRDGIVPANEVLRMRRVLDKVAGPKASQGVIMKPGEQMAKQEAISGLRSGLRESSPELTGIGKRLQSIGFDQQGKRGPVLEAFRGYENRANVRNPITLSGAVTGGLGAGVGAGVGGPFGAAVGALGANIAKNALTSPRGIKAVSQGGQSLARGVGTAKRVSTPVVKQSLNIGRTGAISNRTSERVQSKPQLPIQKEEPKSNLLSFVRNIPRNIKSLFSRRN